MALRSCKNKLSCGLRKFCLSLEPFQSDDSDFEPDEEIPRRPLNVSAITAYNDKPVVENQERTQRVDSEEGAGEGGEGGGRVGRERRLILGLPREAEPSFHRESQEV